MLSVRSHLEEWKKRLPLLTIQAAAEEYRTSLDWMHVHGQASLALILSARTHGLIAANEQPLLATTLINPNAAEPITLFAVRCYLHELGDVILEKRVACAPDVVRTFFSLYLEALSTTSVPRSVRAELTALLGGE